MDGPHTPLLLSPTPPSADQAPERGFKISLQSKQPLLCWRPYLCSVVLQLKQKSRVSLQCNNKSNKRIVSPFVFLHLLLFAQPSQIEQVPFVASLCRVCTLSPWLHWFSLVSTQSPITRMLGWWKFLIAPQCVCVCAFVSLW